MVKSFFSFLPIWGIDQILLALPRSWAISFCETLAWVVSLFMARRRALMLKNLQLAFPEKSETELKKIVAGVWRNIGRVAGEFIRLSDINQENYRDYFEIIGADVLEKAKAKGKGLIFIGFHYGNWEMSGVGGNFASNGITAVARPIKNKFVEKWVKQKRGAGGMDVILHRDAVRGCLRVLRAKKSVGILVDQNLYQGGVFVNFFGRPAATTPLPALLQSRTGAPVLILYCERQQGKIKLIFRETPPLPTEGDAQDLMQTITQIISSELEEIIRGHPEQWFWVHNRWKRQPTPDELLLTP